MVLSIRFYLRRRRRRRVYAIPSASGPSHLTSPIHKLKAKRKHKLEKCKEIKIQLRCLDSDSLGWYIISMYVHSSPVSPGAGCGQTPLLPNSLPPPPQSFSSKLYCIISCYNPSPNATPQALLFRPALRDLPSFLNNVESFAFVSWVTQSVLG